MATCGIGDRFDILVEGVDLAVAKNFTAPRAFRLLGIMAVNIAAAASTCNVAVGATVLTATTAAPPLAGDGIIQAQAAIGPTAPVTVLAANSNVAAGATVTVTCGAATDTMVRLMCTGALRTIAIA